MLHDRAKASSIETGDDATVGYFWLEGIVLPERMQLAAWDLGRIVNVARWASVASYLPEDEARVRALEAATLAQQYYASWEAFSLGYLAGHFEWEARILPWAA